MKRRKDLGHKIEKKRVHVGKSQEIKEMGEEWENDPGVLSSSFLRARIVSTSPLRILRCYSAHRGHIQVLSKHLLLVEK